MQSSDIVQTWEEKFYIKYQIKVLFSNRQAPAGST